MVPYGKTHARYEKKSSSNGDTVLSSAIRHEIAGTGVPMSISNMPMVS